MAVKSRRKWMLMATITLMATLACTCALPFNLAGKSAQHDVSLPVIDQVEINHQPAQGDSASQAVPGDMTDPAQAPVAGDALVLALSIDQNHRLLSAFGYNLEQQVIYLPQGRYYIEVLRGDGTWLAYPNLLVDNERAGYGLVDFTRHGSTSISAETTKSEFEALFRFMLAVDHARLTYFEIISSGFQAPLFAVDFSAGWPEEQKLSTAFDALGDEGDVIQAALGFHYRAEGATGIRPGQRGLASIPGLSLLEAIYGFFSIASEDNKKAGEDVLLIYDHMNHDEKEMAFEALLFTQSAGVMAGVNNYDDFIEKVRRGEIADMRAVRRELAQQGPLSGLFQTINPDTNRPGLEIIHQLGVNALEKGADLYVEINKGILTVTFPGIDKGFDYADQAEEWLNYIDAVYKDPMGVLEGAAWDQLEELVSDSIKASILERFPDTPEDIAEALAGRVFDEMKTTIIQKGTQLQDVLVLDDPQEDLDGDGEPGSPVIVYEGQVLVANKPPLDVFYLSDSYVVLEVADDTIKVTVEFTLVAELKRDLDNEIVCTATMERVYLGQVPYDTSISLDLSLSTYDNILSGSDCGGVEAVVVSQQPLVGTFSPDGSFNGSIRNAWTIVAAKVE